MPQAVEAGGLICVSALFGADTQTHAIAGDARAELKQVFANLAAIPAAAGGCLTHAVRVSIVMPGLQRDRPVVEVGLTTAVQAARDQLVTAQGTEPTDPTGTGAAERVRV